MYILIDNEHFCQKHTFSCHQEKARVFFADTEATKTHRFKRLDRQKGAHASLADTEATKTHRFREGCAVFTKNS